MQKKKEAKKKMATKGSRLRARNYTPNCIFYLKYQIDGFTKGLAPLLDAWRQRHQTVLMTSSSRHHHPCPTAGDGMPVSAHDGGTAVITDRMGSCATFMPGCPPRHHNGCWQLGKTPASLFLGGLAIKPKSTFPDF